MSVLRRKFVKYFLITFAVLVVVSGLLLGAFQLVVARAPEYRVQLQDWVSERAGLVIEFRKLSARLRTYGPELVFDDAIVRTPDRTRVLATARRGSIGFDLWTCLSTGRLTAGRFSLDAPQIGLIRTRDGRIQLVGQSALPERDAKPVAVEQLPVGIFRVRNAVVSFRDEATGRGPWSLSGVDFILDRRSALLDLRGSASLPAALGRGLQFSGRAVGRLEAPDSVLTTFNFQGEQLDLAGWADVLPDEWPVPDTGHGAMSLGIAMRGRELTGLTAKVDVANVTAVAPPWTIGLPKAQPLQIRTDEELTAAAAAQAASSIETPAEPEPPSPTPELLSYQRIAFDMKVARAGDEWQVSATNVDLAREGSSWHGNRLEARWSNTAAAGVNLSGKADRVVLQNLWPLLAYLPQSEGLARLRALRASGEVTDLTVSAQRKSASDAQIYSVQARINALGFQPTLGQPGFTGLSGQLRATQDGGEAQLDSTSVQFALPHVFREPLQAQSVRGSLNWRHAPAGWQIDGKDLRIASEDGNAVASLAMQIPADGSSPILQMTAHAKDLRAAATPKYLPANKLSGKTLDWLDHAFVSGQVLEGDMRLNGPLRAFPFRKGEGEFLVRGRVTGMTFAYQAGWTPATDLAAEVEFRNQGMRVRSATAAVGGLQVAEVTGEFADFKTGEISIKATASGDLDPALKYLQTSPISAALGQQFARLHGQGETHSSVSLWLPLKRIADRRIVVTTQLKGATVRLGDLDAPITRLSGSLRVKQSLPDAAALQGQWLGGPLNVSIAADTSRTAMLTAKGQAAADRLAPLLHLPAPASVSGTTQWQLQTRLEQAPDSPAGATQAPSKGQARRFVIDADLNGFGINLPYPVGKREDELRPLHAEINYDGAEEMLTQAALGNVRALVRLQQSKGEWALDRGLVRADGRVPRLPRNHGLRLAGAIDRLVLDDWFALRGEATSGASHLSDILHSASLRVGTLQLYGYQWLDVHGELQPQEAGWDVEVSGPNASGKLFIPSDFSGSKPLTATMERLVVTGVEGAPGGNAPRDPRSWPAVRAFVAELHVDNHAIGAVDVRASRVETGIRIDAVTLVNEAVQGEAHGDWLITPSGQQSHLTAKVTSTDVSATLRALNYPQFMEAKRGELSVALAWPGGFDRQFLDNASGTLIVDAQNGQLLNLQPGAGRVLGLFSVAALPRRLALDFSDLTDKGLGFDSVHGDFELRNGNAYTSNLLLRGPAAEIGIAGRVGLGARDYDQTAVVTGNLGATLPVAGALAGGPAVGAALLLFSQVFKEPLKGITRAYYRITGNWDDPLVERVDAAESKATAAASNTAGK